ncbi:MAG: lipopolysaccharide biosynthesis protein [Solirubrobacteraceae bacterium]
MSEEQAPPPDAAAATTSRSVLRGGAWYTASSGIPQIYTAVTSILAARFLGKADFGQQSFIALNAILLSTLFSSSMFVAVMRYVGETVGAGRPRLLRSLMSWAWKIEAAAALVAAAILVGVAAAGGEPTGAWALAGIVSALAILHTVPTAVMVGMQLFRQAAVVGLTTGLVSTIATALVLWAGGGITGMFAVEVAAAAANLAWTGTLARRAVGPGEPVPTAATRDLQRRAGHYALVAGAGVLLEQIVASRTEFFFLKAFSTNEAIALYTIAFSMVVALRLVPSALGGTIAPAFATLFGARQDDRIRSGFTRALRLVLVVTLPLSAAAVALGPELVRLVYGSQYAGVAQPLRIMLTVFPLMALSSLAGAHLAGLGRVRVSLAANGLGAAVDIGLALAFVPLLGASGAAVANAGGQAAHALVLLAVSVSVLGRSAWRLWSVAPSAVAAVLACAAGWAAVEAVGGLLGLLAGGIAFAAVYTTAAVAVGVLTADDAGWLETTVGGRLGGWVGRVAGRVTIRWVF